MYYSRSLGKESFARKLWSFQSNSLAVKRSMPEYQYRDSVGEESKLQCRKAKVEDQYHVCRVGGASKFINKDLPNYLSLLG